MRMKLGDIATLVGGSVIGDPELWIEGLAAPESPAKNYLSIAWENSVLKQLPADIPLLSFAEMLEKRENGIAVKDPRVALIPLLQRFDERGPYPSGIHASCRIHESCQLGSSISMGPNCVIAEGCRIGSGSVLQSGVVLGPNVTLGENCRIEAGVVIHDDSVLGDRVIIKSNSVIGSDGFGFIQNKEGERVRVPQIGRVVLEDDVEIGALTTVDRATFGETRVGQGTKVGNHVQIAHNSKIGKHCIFAGFIAMGGSVTIGDGTLVAGFSGFADHITIGKNVTVAGRAGVSKGVPDNEVYSGFPAQNHKKEQRFQASLRRVPDLLERIKDLEARLKQLEGQK